MIRLLPNTLTLANLFCGCCAVLFILNGRVPEAALFTLGSFALDYADGLAARALGVASPLGKELDSLADVISFGFVPGALFYHMLVQVACPDAWELYPPNNIRPAICTTALPAFVLSAFAALRLGRFNLDTRQAHYFIGLTTPATTVFVLGLALASGHNRFGINAVLLHVPVLYALIALLCVLMNAELPLFGLKFSGRSWWRAPAFLALFVLLVYPLRELALCAVVVVYVLASVFWSGAVVEEG
ncbi:MAG: CDP-alcohol phosphatidyltransferase family protein [Saprospiraceae bacterium]|nr:CDP-alcohol phosphatidyltransferase family protein [Saprospiraceae bacterium]